MEDQGIVARLWGKKFVERAMERRVRRRTSDRDAIVWSVNDGTGQDWYALVKIQGSNTAIKARYPMGNRSKTEFIRPGCPVIVRHPKGNRGYMEIVGVGRAIPSPVSGDTFPPAATLGDRIVTEGVLVTQTETVGMQVNVEPFTFMIDEETYSFTAEITNAIVMNDPAPMIMSDPAPAVMGQGEYIVEIDAAPAAGYGRYDILVIGADLVIDYIAGTPVSLSTEPTTPNVPEGHVLVKRLFIWSGLTELTNADIGAEWTEPAPRETILTFSGSNISEGDNGEWRMDWDAGDSYPTCSLGVAVKDQYGRSYTLGTNCTVSMLAGTGTVANSSSGSFGTSATKLFFQSSHTFTYKRNQIASPEIFPIFQAAFDGYPSLQSVTMLVLLDTYGVPLS